MRAFSLVELSIVLVILGLLTGGILAGQSLIRASELRSVTTELAAYSTASRSFKDRYMALAGDMPNATRFWGTAATGSDCMTTVGTGTATCDGNGNGRIGNNWNACNTGFPEKNESLRFWQHLANAGLIAGSFTGASAGGSVCANGNGVNVPTARLHGKFFWRIISMGPSSAGSNWYRQDINNAFGMGDDLGSFSPYLRPSEAWGIDSKLDDGIPKSGKVQTHTNSSHGNCADATGDGYQLTIDSIACSLEFLDML